MNLLPSPEQQQIVDAAVAFLTKELPAPAPAAGELGRSMHHSGLRSDPEPAPGGLAGELGRSMHQSGLRSDPEPAPAAVDRERWARMGALGWFSLGVAESAGGAGYGVVEEALLFRELGRALAPGPLLAQVLAVHAAGDTGQAADLAAGSLVAGLAEPHGDDGWYRLLDAGGADVLAVAGAGGVSIVDAGLARDRTTQTGVDPATAVELARLDPHPAAAGGVERGRVLVAAMLAGICEATRDESAAYAKVREQFGKPIGAFQAVKHRCADMAVRAEAAAGLTFLAALSLQGGEPELVPLAKALASEHALANAADDIQNHGGTGFTADCRAHRYLKRAQLLATVLGTPAGFFAEAGRRR